MCGRLGSCQTFTRHCTSTHLNGNWFKMIESYPSTYYISPSRAFLKGPTAGEKKKEEEKASLLDFGDGVLCMKMWNWFSPTLPQLFPSNSSAPGKKRRKKAWMCGSGRAFSLVLNFTIKSPCHCITWSVKRLWLGCNMNAPISFSYLLIELFFFFMSIFMAL